MAQRRIFTNASRYVTPVPLSRHTSLHSNDILRSAFCRQALCCRRLVCSTRVVSRVRTFESENPHLVQTEDGSVPDHEKIFFEDFKPGEDIPMVPLPPFDDGSGKILASPELHSLADRVLELSLVEVHQLSQLFNDHFDLDDEIAPMEMGVAPSSGENAEGQAAEERTVFDLKLTGFDSKSKIKVIKEVRSIAELGLKEAKELVEGAPKVVRKDIKKEDAEQLKEKLEAVGATVEII